jgi:hypothetical protein
METKPKLLSPEQAMKIKKPVVYALCMSDGNVFYIGKTKSPASRFRQYMRPEKCHSNLIAEKISAGNGFMVKVLDYDPVDLSGKELQRIKEFDGLTVNVMGRGSNHRDPYGAKPWSTGIGTLTPSSFLMTNLKMSTHSPVLSKRLRKMIGKMDNLKRCVFEIDVFREMHPIAQKLLMPWFNATALKMIEYMESHHVKN